MRKSAAEERDYLREITPGRSYAQITEMFNAKFENRITIVQVKTFIKNNKLKTGRTGYFEKGNTPHNKGKKRWWAGGEAAWFKKGNTPHNHKPVGSTRVTKYGYTKIKTAEPNKWRMLHAVIWENANGSAPKGHVVIFADGDRQNITLNNLILVSRAQLAMINKFKLISASAELTKTGALTAELILKLCAKRKGAHV